MIFIDIRCAGNRHGYLLPEEFFCAAGFNRIEKLIREAYDA